MTREPSAVSLIAEGFSRIADAVGLILLCLLGWRMFFVFDSALQTRALVVGLIGTLACWADRRSAKNVPLAMLAYVAIGLISAAVHSWSAVASTPEPAWLSLFAPASHLVVMAVFIYGVAYLLRTPWRLSLFVVLVAASIGILASQIAFDRASVGFVYERGGPSLPSVPHWSGIHGASLFLTIGLPLVAAIAIASRSLARRVSGALLAAGLFGVAYLNGSRGGLVSMGLVAAAMVLFALVSRSRVRLKPVVLLGTVAVLLVGGAAATWSVRARFANGQDFSGRTLIWEPTARLALDHPWLGVGPGRFPQAIIESGYAKYYLTYYGALNNAHNLFLQTAAETGLIGATCLIVFTLWAVRACWRTWVSGETPIVALGVLFAVFGFLVHSVTENFLDSRAEVERTRLLVWMVFAAACALQRLPRACGHHA